MSKSSLEVLQKKVEILQNKLSEYEELDKLLREKEEKFRLIFETNPDSIGISKADGTIVEVNEAFSNLTGYSSKEVIGKSSLDIGLWSDPDLRKNAFKELKNKGFVSNLESKFLTKDGSIKHIISSAKAVMIKNEQYIIAMSKDITDSMKSQNALIESEKRYRELFENMSNCVAVYQPVNNGKDFIFKDFNRRAEGVENIDREKIINKSVTKAFPSVKDFGLFEVFQRVWKTGQPEHFPLSFYKDNRISGWRENYVYKLPTGEIVAIYDDVTDRKKAEEALKNNEATMRSIFLAAPVGIGMVINRVIVKANDRLCEMVGYTREELIGKNARIIYPTDKDYEFVGREKYAQISEKGTGTVETRWLRKDGKIIDIILSSTPLDPENYSLGVTFTALDITDRKKMEKEREHYLRELTEKNVELEQIVYVTSHDLRSPLINIQGFSKELGELINQISTEISEKDNLPEIKNRLSSIINEEIPESLNFILTSISKMDSLLSGLLRLSRLGREALNIKKLDMNKLVSDVLINFEFQIKKSEIDINVKKLPQCIGDENQISQVFSNLVSNSLKYISNDKRSIVKISGTKENKKSVYKIEDNGVGITREHQKKIFEIFHRLEPDKSEGEGLGLTIVKKILGRHKGKIWLESKPGQGSKFYIQLPSD